MKRCGRLASSLDGFGFTILYQLLILTQVADLSAHVGTSATKVGIMTEKIKKLEQLVTCCSWNERSHRCWRRYVIECDHFRQERPE